MLGLTRRELETCPWESDCGPAAKAPDEPPNPTGYAPPLDSTTNLAMTPIMWILWPPGQAGSIRSGLAIANTTITTNTMTLEVTHVDGSLAVPPATRALPPSGQIARFIDEIVTLPDNFFGVLRVTSTGDVAVVGLRLRINENGELKMTTTPPSNKTGPSTTADMFFPHIADSGGGGTQFILFSGTEGQASAETLRFIDASGRPLDLTNTQP